MELHFKIRALRLDKKLFQQYVADILNICQKAYSKIESGKTALTVYRLEELAKIHNLSTWELLVVDINVLLNKKELNPKDSPIKLINDFNVLVGIYETKIKNLEKENKLLKNKLKKLRQ
ncbi:MAG: helix-turn-helix domain-containing protein [Vicingaceae bacterium]|nr:helix-turn-helix domain-containing protein [Vicingaceae bacterium]